MPNTITRSRVERDSYPIQIYTDPVYFHKSQVRRGAMLRSFGRTSYNTLWSVLTIWTHTGSGTNGRRHMVESAQKLSDRLELRCVTTGEIRRDPPGRAPVRVGVRPLAAGGVR